MCLYLKNWRYIVYLCHLKSVFFYRLERYILVEQSAKSIKDGTCDIVPPNKLIINFHFLWCASENDFESFGFLYYPVNYITKVFYIANKGSFLHLIVFKKSDLFKFHDYLHEFVWEILKELNFFRESGPVLSKTGVILQKLSK